MNGKLDFSQSLKKRVSLLKGKSVDIYDHVLNKITYTPGVHLLCLILKELGYKLAVISGGFLPIVQRIKHDLGILYFIIF